MVGFVWSIDRIDGRLGMGASKPLVKGGGNGGFWYGRCVERSEYEEGYAAAEAGMAYAEGFGGVVL
jgi:hypothetical protein